MIKRRNKIDTLVVKNLKDGPGEVSQIPIATKEEMLNHARLFARMHLEENSGIGYHEHEKETEIYYILNGEAKYSDNGNQTIVKQGDVCICRPLEGHNITAINGSCDFIAIIILE